jgi:hypothetical protein
MNSPPKERRVGYLTNAAQPDIEWTLSLGNQTNHEPTPSSAEEKPIAIISKNPEVFWRAELAFGVEPDADWREAFCAAVHKGLPRM